jgi:type IV secretory pathway VirB10-like protein
MAESEHDDLADALARLAKGDVAPSEHKPAPPAPITQPVKQMRPAAKPIPARPPAPVSTAPTAPKPARPVAPALTTPAPAPAAPSPRPAAPAPVAAAGGARKPRPTAPTLRHGTVPTTGAEVDGGQSTGLSAGSESADAVDDDDSVIVPAPEASVFMPRAKPTTSAEVRAAIARRKSLNLRRTLIPILLTLGVITLVFGSMKFFSGPDSMLANIPGYMPIILLIAAAVLLVLAVFNMLSVKVQLDAERK